LCMHKDTCRDRWPDANEASCKLLTHSFAKGSFANMRQQVSDSVGEGGIGMVLAVLFLLVGIVALCYGAWKMFGTGSYDLNTTDLNDFDDDDDDDDDSDDELDEKKKKKQEKKAKKEKKEKKKKKKKDEELMLADDDDDDDDDKSGKKKKKKKSDD